MQPVLTAKGVSKRFAQFYALQNVDFEVYSGEVNVLIGENGAGKSTLMKILSGVYTKDEGVITVAGKEVHITSPAAAERIGIGTVYQELALVPELTVAENMFLGADLVTGRARFINWKRLYAEAARILRELVGMEVDVAQKVKNLGIAQQQMIEIARVIHRNSRILILDEPTAVLTGREVEKLFELIASLQKRGIAIVYISHRMEEIFAIGNRVTVLRDGQMAGRALVADICTDTLIQMMVGHSIKNQFPRADFTDIEKREVLRAQGLCREKAVRDVSFTVRTGEIVGFAGLVGAGRTEVARIVFGADKPDAGDIFINGKKVRPRHPIDSIRRGVALLPEDRKTQGLVLKRSVVENTSLVALKKVFRAWAF